MATYTLTSLNVNEGMHLALQTNFFKNTNADIICLQETTPELTKYFANKLGLSYVYSTTWKKPSEDSGIAILSKVNRKSSVEISYWKDKKTSEEQTRRVMLASTFTLQGISLTVINIHFIWSPRGEPSTEQIKAIQQVKRLVSDKKNLILAGDFNAPRGGEVFSILSKHLTDNVPRHYTTSIDENFHRNGKFPAMVDGLFTQKSSRVKVINAKLECDVSDHLALVTNIEIEEGAGDEQ